MLVSDVSGINTISSEFTKKDNSNTVLFSEILKEQQIKSEGENKIESEVKSLNDDNNFKPKYSTGVFASGQSYVMYNTEECLTENDKAFLKTMEYPTDNFSDINQLASLIAMDRVDGYLKGPITKEYLFGDKSQGIPGLADRFSDENDKRRITDLCSVLMNSLDNA